MVKITRFWLVFALLLVVIGLGIFTGVLAANDWDFKKLDTEEHIVNNYEVNERFNKISINVETTNINFKLSTDGQCKVVCNETKKINHTVKVENDTLVVKVNDTRKWYDYITVFPNSLELTVYLLNDEYSSLEVDTSTGNVEIPSDFKFESINIKGTTGNVKCLASVLNKMTICRSTGNITINDAIAGEIDLSTSTGNIELNSITCNGNLKIQVSTGKVNLTSVKCNNLNSIGKTGSIILNSVMVTNFMYIERSTGNVNLNACDANSISIIVSTGNVTGSLLSDKIFITESSTGKVNVPKTTSGGTCEIKTTTGNITIEIQ